MSSASLQQQVTQAQAARNAGRISAQEYNQWYANQSRLIAAAKAKEAQQAKQTQPTAQQKPASPLPSEPGSSNYVVQGSYVQGGAAIREADTRNVVGVIKTPKTTPPIDVARAGKAFDAPAQTQPPPKLEPNRAYIVEAPQPVKQVSAKESVALNPLSGGSGVVGVQRPTFGNPTAKGQVLLNTPEAKALALTVASLPVGGGAGLVGSGAKAVAVGSTKTVASAAAKTIAKQAALGAGASVGFNQAFKSATGGGLLTPTEAAEAAAFGAILAPTGAKLNSVLKLSGFSARQIAGRTGVNAAIGGGLSGGLEFATQGKVSPTTVLIGAGVGAGFSLGGEVLAGGARRISSRINAGRVDRQNKIFDASYKVGEALNADAQVAAKRAELPLFSKTKTDFYTGMRVDDYLVGADKAIKFRPLSESGFTQSQLAALRQRGAITSKPVEPFKIPQTSKRISSSDFTLKFSQTTQRDMRTFKLQPQPELAIAPKPSKARTVYAEPERFTEAEKLFSRARMGELDVNVGTIAELGISAQRSRTALTVPKTRTLTRTNTSTKLQRRFAPSTFLVPMTSSAASPNVSAGQKAIFGTGSKTTPNITPDYMPTPFTEPRITPQPKFTPDPLPKPFNEVYPIIETQPIREYSVPRMPTISLGGGSGASRGGGLFGGKWFKKKHKVKTPLQMLETFGVAPRTKTKVAKSNKPKRSNKKRRKTKR